MNIRIKPQQKNMLSKLVLFISACAFIIEFVTFEKIGLVTTAIAIFAFGSLLFSIPDISDLREKICSAKSVPACFLSLTISFLNGFLFCRRGFAFIDKGNTAFSFAGIGIKTLLIIFSVFCSLLGIIFVVYVLTSVFGTANSEKRVLADFAGEKVKAVRNIIYTCRISVSFTFIVGIVCYMFLMTNFLPNNDGSHSLFDFGVGGMTSGRWGLDILDHIFPAAEMSWFTGLLSLFVMTVGILLTFQIFKIENVIMQCLTGGLIISFPTLTSFMNYMFAGAVYSLSFLCAVTAVCLIRREEKRLYPAVIFLLVISLSIYQALIAVAAAYLVVLLIDDLLKEKDTVKIFLLRVLKYFLLLVFSMGVYWLITTLVLKLYHTGINGYITGQLDHSNNMISRVAHTYINFVKFFGNDEFGLISTSVSRIGHIACLLFVAAGTVKYLFKPGKKINKLFLLILLAVFPVAVNSVLLLTTQDGISTLVLYSFIAVYLLCVVFLRGTGGSFGGIDLKKVAAVTFSLIVLSNVYIANLNGFKQFFAYENSYSVLTSVATQIAETPGFDKNSKIALIGNYADENTVVSSDVFEHLPRGSYLLTNVYFRNEFMNNFLGRSLKYATADEVNDLSRDIRVLEMPCYPYYGSVAYIDGYIVVKLGASTDN